MGDTNINLRIPSLEIAAQQFGNAFTNKGRPLDLREKSLGRAVFGNSIRLDQITIAQASVVAAPTTLGNVIRIGIGYHLPDYVLIHELTHIWQFQTRGLEYISNSLCHQAFATITSGDRGGAYAYEIVDGQSFYKYNAEQQAHIVEDFFLNANGESNNEEYKRMIAQVRSAIPSLTDSQRYMESMYGPQVKGSTPPNTSTVPIFRLEF